MACTLMVLPVGGTPKKIPRWVPLMVKRAATRHLRNLADEIEWRSYRPPPPYRLDVEILSVRDLRMRAQREKAPSRSNSAAASATMSSR